MVSINWYSSTIIVVDSVHIDSIDIDIVDSLSIDVDSRSYLDTRVCSDGRTSPTLLRLGLVTSHLAARPIGQDSSVLCNYHHAYHAPQLRASLLQPAARRQRLQRARGQTTRCRSATIACQHADAPWLSNIA